MSLKQLFFDFAVTLSHIPRVDISKSGQYLSKNADLEEIQKPPGELYRPHHRSETLQNNILRINLRAISNDRTS